MDLQGIERVAAIGDIHANARALESAVEVLQHINPDVVLVLGDVLSYGCDPREVLESLSRLSESFDIRFVLGNHDEIYRNLALGIAEVDDLEGPVRESIRWTIAEVGVEWSSNVTWNREVRFAATLFSHANPFGADDWTYLNSTSVTHRAIWELKRRQMRLGVFGHTHRQRVVQGGGIGARLLPTGDRVLVPPGDTALVTLGSIGQPRDESLWGSVAVVTGTATSQTLEVDFIPVEYDVEAHVRSIRESNLSASTREWLCGFFGKSI